MKKIFIIVFCMLILLSFLNSCFSHKQIEYYSQKENYISATGTISHMKYNDDSTELYIDFSELIPMMDDTCFKIVGDNLKVVQDNKIDDKLTVGTQISFITAPKYFGDGYVMPIVAISINGDTLLEFEEGYNNLLAWLG